MNHTQPVSLNLNVRGLNKSATLAISERVHQLRRQDHTVYNMGLGQSPFPVPVSVVEALRLAAPEKDYLPVQGLRELREAVADFHRKYDHVQAHPDRVLIGPGSKELMFLLQLTYYGEIIVAPPCWVSYLPQARIIGRKVSLIQTSFETGWKLTPAQLLESFEIVNDDSRPRLLVLNYPSNPVGNTYTAIELQEIAEVCRRFDVVVLSDEIYAGLHHHGEHVSIAQFYPQRTIISSGLSKWCGAGGWRLGTFAFPRELDWLLDTMAAVASETYTSVCAPIQHAAVTAFRGGVDIEHYLWHARRILAALGQQCAQLLADAGVRVHPPTGAFYLFPDFTPFTEQLNQRGIHNGTQMCERLLDEAKVAMLPGVAFARSRRELTARLSLVDFDGARAMAASENTPLHEPLPEDFARQWCGQVLEGIEKIVSWLG
ncbi:MAG: aminotransferase class I/II-fold pyridoxal phosphate-dependent enzyme [Planctomycetota bacterium]